MSTPDPPAYDAHDTATTISQASTQSPEHLAPLIRAVLDRNAELAAQNTAMISLLRAIHSSLENQRPSRPAGDTAPGSRDSAPGSRDSAAGDGPRRHTRSSSRPTSSSTPLSSASTTLPTSSSTAPPSPAAAAWTAILSSPSRSSPPFKQAFHAHSPPPSISPILHSPKNAWAHWSYEAAYPVLTSFLRETRNPGGGKGRARVGIADYGGGAKGGEVGRWYEMRGRVGELWARLREREYLDGDGGGGTAARVVQIVDVSPVVLTALLAATPSIDLSYLVAFMERHLKFSNWARASLLKFGDLSWSSYTFEYHFSFFYVTGEAHDTKSARPDPRSIRRSAPFGIDPSGETKYIHEETRSLLLIGHFSDVLTCVQLADAYFKYDPYQRPTPEDHAFRTYNPAEPPALLLLSWIAVTLHHVCWRWQSAIDTVHDEITSAGEIVFMADRSDLMADDPHFSLSKRYFWALQAYKLFEETIAETITTWADFKAHSLPKLHHHPGISPAAWARSIADIDSAHTQLSRKITRLQKHRAEIKDLRRGLISASALFDSRTAVRQGENIRLLTYITILFFPLSFATDLFGMQWIPSGRATWHAFAAVLPAIFLATALFVFNLSTLSDAASTLAEAFSNALRDRMRACPHTVWPARAARLTRHAAQAKPPVRKARHTAVGWVYALFLLEGTAVALPRGEIAALVQHFRSPRPRSRTNGEKDADVGPVSPTGEGRGARSARDKVLLSLAQAQREEEAARARHRRVWQRVPGLAARAAAWGLLGLRALLVPVWAAMLAVECGVLVLVFAISGLWEGRGREKERVREKPWERAWHFLGLNEILPVRRAEQGIAGLMMTMRRAATESGNARPSAESGS